MGMRGINVGMIGIRRIRVGMQGIRVRIFVKEWYWWIRTVERNKIKRKYVHLWKYSFDTLVWETIKETKLNTNHCFHKYYFILINQKENILDINLFHVIVKCPETAPHRCSSEKVFCKNAANLLETTHAEA